MSDSEPKEPFLSVDFGEEGGRFKWMTAEDAIEWINNILNSWQWASVVYHIHLNDHLNAAQASIREVSAYIQDRYRDPEYIARRLSFIRSELERMIKPCLWLFPNHPQRLFVEKMRDAGRSKEAASLVVYWLKQDLRKIPIHIVVPALVQWEFYQHGLQDRAEAESASLKKIAGEMQTKLTELQASERIQQSRFEALHSTIAKQSTNQQKTFDDSQEVRNCEWKKQCEESQKELHHIKETYDNHMSLAAPVEYWESKRKQHGRWAVWSFIATFVCMIILGLVLHSELQAAGKMVEDNRAAAIAALQKAPISSALNQAASNSNPATVTASAAQSIAMVNILESAAMWKLGSSILLATLSFWFIRLLVRIFLSHLHLENDAAERVTMAKTYLAMIRDDALPKGENIATVLAALFRPTGDGIVKDEGLPPTAMEWITKLGGK